VFSEYGKKGIPIRKEIHELLRVIDLIIPQKISPMINIEDIIRWENFEKCMQYHIENPNAQLQKEIFTFIYKILLLHPPIRGIVVDQNLLIENNLNDYTFLDAFNEF
jgi:hypothetical protein